MTRGGEGRAADTIVGIATPPGTGAIGLIRVSGPQAVRVVSRVVRLRVPGGLEACTPRVLYRTIVIDPLTDADIDMALVAKMPGPGSYTGDDVVELSCHGNPILLGQIVSVLMGGGARLAEPGEFTRRAYLNGRMDLLQVEAVAELIGARTERAVRLAARQLGGGLSNQITTIREGLVDLMASLEVTLDFPEEEGLGLTQEEAIKRAEWLAGGLARLIASTRQGRAVQDGLAIMLTGAPNVGKSSLLNALLGRERAIVSETPGTTRDLVDGTVVIRGVSVRLIDGAGLGTPRDDIDSEGMRRARRALDESDLVLVVLDSSRPISPVDYEVLALTAKGRRLVIANKSDLPLAWQEPVAVDCACSALTGAGVGAVLDRLNGWVDERTALDGEDGGIVASLRVLEQLVDAQLSITRASEGLEQVATEVGLVDLRAALADLDRVLGIDADEAVLDRIFSTFCIGK